MHQTKSKNLLFKVQSMEQPSLHLFWENLWKHLQKIELLKMEVNEEIVLKMIKLDNHNAKCQLQCAQLFVGVMRQGNGNIHSTS